MMWIAGWGVTGRNGLPDMSLSCVLVLDLCVSHGFSVTNMVVEGALLGIFREYGVVCVRACMHALGQPVSGDVVMTHRIILPAPFPATA